MIGWNEYQQQALTTAIYPLKRELEYTLDGLVSELGELAEVYLWAPRNAWNSADVEFTPQITQLAVSEAGDVFWYIAAVADALKLPLDRIAMTEGGIEPHYNKALNILELMVAVGNIAGLLKKAIRDEDGYLSTDRYTKIILELHRALWLTDNFVQLLGTTRHAVMNANLNKLADRKTRGVLQGSGNNR